jgi:hypothetical protein
MSNGVEDPQQAQEAGDVRLDEQQAAKGKGKAPAANDEMPIDESEEDDEEEEEEVSFALSHLLRHLAPLDTPPRPNTHVASPISRDTYS